MKIHDINIKLSRVLIIVLIAVIATSAIVKALTDQPFTINNGVYPGAATYTIWGPDGSGAYNAKNWYGVEVVSGGSDVGAVFNAVMDIAVSGDSIFFPSGSYSYSTTLTIDVANVTVYGTGTGTYLYQIAGSDLAIALDVQTAYVHIHDLWLDGNYAVNSNTCGIKLSSANADYFELYNCHVRHFPTHCLWLSTGNNIFKIHDNYMTESSSGPAVQLSGSADGKFYFNDVGGCASTTTGVFYVSTGAHIHISNNKFFGSDEYYLFLTTPVNCIISDNIIGGGSPYGDKDCIYIASGVEAYGHGNTISGNTFYGTGNARDGIRLNGAYVGNNTITGNTFRDFTDHGIYEVDATSNWNLAVGNVFSNCTTPILFKGSNSTATANTQGVTEYP